METNNGYNFKITLVIKNDPNEDDEFSGGTYKIDFEECNYSINGNYMVIESKKEDSIIGQLFELKTIKSYKIWQ